MKRGASLAVVGAVALGCMTIAANAAPLIPKSASQTDWNIVQVWGGCGWGFHPNPWGRCVPNHRWGYYRYRPYYGYRPYGRYSYGGGYVTGIGTDTNRSIRNKAI